MSWEKGEVVRMRLILRTGDGRPFEVRIMVRLPSLAPTLFHVVTRLPHRGRAVRLEQYWGWAEALEAVGLSE